MPLRIGQSRFTLLVVDDEPNVLAAFRRYLKTYPIELITTSSTKEAFNILEAREVHVLLADYRMPDISGVDLCKISKERWPKTVRIIMSGQLDLPKAQVNVSPDLVFNLLVKPWQERELLVELENAFEEWRLQNRLSELKNESEKSKLEEIDVRRRLEDVSSLRSQRTQLSKKIIEQKYRQLKFLINIIKTLSTGIDKKSFEEFLSKETEHLINNSNKEILNEIIPQVNLARESFDQQLHVDSISSELAANIMGPISELMTFMELFEEEFGENRIKNEFLSLREEFNRCYNMLEQAMLVSATNESESHSAIDLNEIVERTLLSLSDIINRSNVSIVLNLTKELPQIIGDIEKLQKVTKNLVENALKSLENGGTISIETKCDDRGFVYLTVSDSGSRLYSADIAKIFDPQSKISNRNLAASQAIIKRHKGNIFLSTKKGEGTTLTVSLPQAGGRA